MQNIFSLALILLVTHGFAQMSFLPYDYFTGGNRIYLGEQDLNKVFELDTDKLLIVDQPKKEIRYEYELNEEGNPVVIRKYEKGKLVQTTKSAYEGMLLSYNEVVDEKGRVVAKLESSFENERPTMLRIDKKGKITSVKIWTYNEHQQVLSAKEFKKGKVKPHRVWTHTYWDEKQRKETVLSNGKGKVLHTWSYDCKEEGEVDVPKNQTEVCKDTKVEDNVLIKTFHYTDKKGDVTKAVQYYSLPDSTLIAAKRYNAEDELISESLREGNADILNVYRKFKKGKLKYESIRTYNEDGLIVSSKNTTKGKVYEISYARTPNELTIQTSWKGKPTKNGKSVVFQKEIEEARLR